MAKSRAQKQAWIAETTEQMNSAEIVLLAHYKGLNVAQLSDLRLQVRKAGASIKVTKNKLAQRALKGTRYEPLLPQFKGPTIMAYANDPVSAAKTLNEFAKKNEKLVLLGGAFGDTLLDKSGVGQLANLPSLDELRAKILALLNTPATRIAAVLQAPAGGVARCIGAHARQGE